MPTLKADVLKAVEKAVEQKQVSAKDANALMMLDEFVTSLPTEKEVHAELAKTWPANLRDVLSERITLEYALLGKKELAAKFKKAIPGYEDNPVMKNAFDKLYAAGKSAGKLA